MTTPETGVWVSNGQMYQELRTLSDGVTRVETKLDGIAQGLTEVGKDVADHETRLRAIEAQPKPAEIEPRITTLERARWPLPSLAALTGIGALVVALLAFLN